MEHQRQLHSTNPLERLSKEIKRRSNVVGIITNPAAVIRVVGGILIEHGRLTGTRDCQRVRHDVQRQHEGEHDEIT